MIIRPFALAMTASTALAGAAAQMVRFDATHEPVARGRDAGDMGIDQDDLFYALVEADIANGAPPFSAVRQFGTGNIVIGHHWARETAHGQTKGGGFLTVANNGKSADTLLGASSPAAARLELHSTTMDGGVMRMRPVAGGVTIPAGRTLTLSPEGYHIMFAGLKRPLKKGAIVPATLTFAKAGKVEVQFKVEPANFGGGY